MGSVLLIGCGFVADLYMRSFALHPEVRILGAHDRDPARQAAFCAHWGIRGFDTLEEVLAEDKAALILNLTNPAQHYDVSKACLMAGFHVWSEKPMALELRHAQELVALASERGVMIASAPSSVLGEAAQTLIRALRNQTAGTPRLIYAELDDGFIPQAPVEDWRSESGAPWPHADEYAVGCTLEHAGYYLSWLIAMFGRVRRVVAASAEVVPLKGGAQYGTPDFSVAVLFFENGPVARLTCSIAAPHDHRIRIVGDDGILAVAKAWDNAAPVRFHRRFRLRRRLIEHPLGKRLRLSGPTHPKVTRKGAAAMNFALGPVEMLEAIAKGQPSRLAGDFALHLTEVTLAIQGAGDAGGAQDMQSDCPRMELMPWAR